MVFAEAAELFWHHTSGDSRTRRTRVLYKPVYNKNSKDNSMQTVVHISLQFPAGKWVNMRNFHLLIKIQDMRGGQNPPTAILTAFVANRAAIVSACFCVFEKQLGGKNIVTLSLYAVHGVWSFCMFWTIALIDLIAKFFFGNNSAE